MPLTATPVVGDSATTLARLTPVALPLAPRRVTCPPMIPLEARKPPFNPVAGYSSEIALMSSAASGAPRVVARVIAVDITAEVSVCCNPNECPNSCTSVVKKASV
jgi:hypothetical protein